MNYDPYQPPRTDAPAHRPTATANGFVVSPVGLAASVLLGIAVGSKVIEIVAWLTLEPRMYASVGSVVDGVGILARVAGIITFLVWIRRIVKNVHSLGISGLQHTPGGAVGGWFVPLRNLVHGYRVVLEVWRASDPANAGAAPHAWLAHDKEDGDAGIILHWWLACITSRIAVVATRFETTFSFWIVSACAEVIAFGLMVIVIRRVDLRQREFARRLEPLA
ncbi:hypothetical protein AKJ09_02031 [Labilithrix luteola]|uniref:DUF4328 domain-containing protein n=1 Tax=Labilithrix luteola TaxID=1391654 RepID=A0A0K1PPC8_9BACT|nr:DUF4328 domain-containing protein [Labilithrix luteola]AKU95367.1 hypothetical protein AKJ09_02031 [Labilithrix luteola]